MQWELQLEIIHVFTTDFVWWYIFGKYAIFVMVISVQSVKKTIWQSHKMYIHVSDTDNSLTNGRFMKFDILGYKCIVIRYDKHLWWYMTTLGYWKSVLVQITYKQT
jgi:hypothetical protein